MNFHFSAMKQVKICQGHACRSNMSEYSFRRAASELGVDAQSGGKAAGIELATCPCQANCQKGPTIVTTIGSQVKVHSRMDPIQTAQLIKILRD
jgi:NADH:ubiquinone oxidoreductase subunit E